MCYLIDIKPQQRNHCLTVSHKLNELPNCKPHLIFLLAIPILLLTGYLSGDTTLDINIHDTYYVIKYMQLTVLVSILFGLIGMIYWIMVNADKRLSKWLSRTHVGLTLSGILIVLILSQFYRPDQKELEFNNNLSLVISLTILISIVGQIIIPINMIYKVIKRENKTTG